MNNYTVLEQPIQTIAGISCRTYNGPEGAPIDIPKLKEKFIQDDIFNKIPGRLSDEIYVLYCDYEGDYTKPYLVVMGCAVSESGNNYPGVISKTLPAGPYAFFNAVGEFPENLMQAWGTIWQTPLDRTYTGDYEVYRDLASLNDIKIFIAIR